MVLQIDPTIEIFHIDFIFGDHMFIQSSSWTSKQNLIVRNNNAIDLFLVGGKHQLRYSGHEKRLKNSQLRNLYVYRTQAREN